MTLDEANYAALLSRVEAIELHYSIGSDMRVEDRKRLDAQDANFEKLKQYVLEALQQGVTHAKAIDAAGEAIRALDAEISKLDANLQEHMVRTDGRLAEIGAMLEAGTVETAKVSENPG